MKYETFHGGRRTAGSRLLRRMWRKVNILVASVASLREVWEAASWEHRRLQDHS